MYFVGPEDDFPSVDLADANGLLAVGRELTPERLRDAYSRGIFPWYEAGQPVLWWSPDPRMVLFPDNLKVSKSMRSLFRKEAFKVTYNRDFMKVIESCGEVPRKGQDGTWITPEIRENYHQLHLEGLAHSVEVWQNDEMVGGLYGIYLKEKGVFCGESMFSTKSNASKYGFISLVRKLEEEGVRLIDCQIYTSHLESLGASEIPRSEFLKYLK